LNKLLLIAACLALSATVALASPSAGAKTYFVTVKVPARATAENFVNGTFKVTVTCKEACKATTSALIRSSAAKRLGFKNVKGKLVLVATSKETLKAQTPTKMSLVLTSEAKKRLAKATSPVQVFGSVKGVPTSRPFVNYSVGWSATLT
jgi:hypothetical protein